MSVRGSEHASGPEAPADGGGALREAQLFARYLVGRDCPPELGERYARACAELLRDPPAPLDGALVSLISRRPWLLGAVDAACGLLRPRALLRTRLLIASAVLETSPETGGAFLPEPLPAAALGVRLVLAGVRTAVLVPVGAAVLLLLAAGRRP